MHAEISKAFMLKKIGILHLKNNNGKVSSKLNYYL